MSGISDDDIQKAITERVNARKEHFREVRLTLLARIADLDKLLELLDSVLHHHRPPRRIVLQMPTLRSLVTGESLMAAYPLRLDAVATFPITLAKPGGGFDQATPGDTFTVTSSDTTNLNAVVGVASGIPNVTDGTPTVTVNWLQQTNPMLTGVGITIADSAGNTTDNADSFDMVAPTFVPDQIGIDVARVQETSQPVPPAAP